MKKIILAFIWGLFLSVNSFAESIIANVDPLYVIENCADKKKSDIQLIVFNDWASENSYDTLMEKHSTKWNRHRKIVEIIEEELEYLSAINFTKLQNEYLQYSSDLPYIQTLFWTYYFDDVKWAEDNENVRLNKRIRSDFFKDFEQTKANLEEKLRNDSALEIKEREETNKLIEMGEKKHNIKANAIITEMKKNLENFLKMSFSDKLKNDIYETYFFDCEKERVGAPISFDNKWK
jgi:hypothetical protein|tara:strand:- start:222 stop:926 length:705 start_codon:yes stop_codon:yes gene_type:complete